MEKINSEVLCEIKIHRPKARRLKTTTKISEKSSLASSISTVNSESSQNHFNNEQIKNNFENVSLEEIKADFQIFSENLEIEELHNEITAILSNPINYEKKEKMIQRCENPLKTNLEKLTESYFEDMIEELNSIDSNGKEDNYEN